MTVRVLLVIALGLALAGCGSADTGLRDEGSAAAGEDAVVSPAEAAVDGGRKPEIPAPAPGVAIVYLLRYDDPAPTRRAVPTGMGIAEAGINALLDGPTPAERSLHYASAIPAEARLNGFSVRNRTAIVDVSALPLEGPDALLALYQIVYTVTAGGGIDAVQVRVDGRPYGLGSITGGSSALEPPLTRADLSFVVASDTRPGSSGCAVAKDEEAIAASPAIRLSRPADGARVEGTLKIRGTLTGPGGPIVIRILQDEVEVANRIIEERCRGAFAATLPIPRTLTGPALVVVASPAEGDRPGTEVRRAIAVAAAG